MHSKRFRNVLPPPLLRYLRLPLSVTVAFEMTPGPPARPVQIKITCCVCLQLVHSTARPCWGKAAAWNLRGHRERGSVTLTPSRHHLKMKIRSKKCQSWAKPIANRTRSSQINRSPSIERFAPACKFLWTFRTCFNRMTFDNIIVSASEKQKPAKDFHIPRNSIQPS